MWNPSLHFVSLEVEKNSNMLLSLDNLTRWVFLPWTHKCVFLLTRVLPLFLHTSWFFLFPKWVDFFSLVDTPQNRKEFKRYYRILSNVSIQHCNPGEWHERRPTGAVVIPMIAFIEGGMRFPIGRVTRDFLNLFRLCPTQFVPICIEY